MSGRDTEWRDLAATDATDRLKDENPHHENCDTRDPMIPGKPCNCYLYWRAAYGEVASANLELHKHVADWRENVEELRAELVDAQVNLNFAVERFQKAEAEVARLKAENDRFRELLDHALSLIREAECGVLSAWDRAKEAAESEPYFCLKCSKRLELEREEKKP